MLGDKVYNPKPSPQTNQEALDNIVQHFFVENNAFSSRAATEREMEEKDSDVPFICLYRGPNGAMCGIGCQIANKDYTPNIENVAACDPPVNSLFSDEIAINLLLDLQKTHDDAGLDKAVMYDKLDRVAQKWNLNLP